MAKGAKGKGTAVQRVGAPITNAPPPVPAGIYADKGRREPVRPPTAGKPAPQLVKSVPGVTKAG